MQVRPLSRAINSDGNPDAVGHGGADAARGVEGMLLDNETRAVVKLYSDGNGGGGPQLFKWDLDKKKVHIKTILYDGEDLQTTGFAG